MPHGQYAQVLAQPAPRPHTVGQIVDAILALGPPERAQLYGLLGVAPTIGDAPVQGATTTRPSDGRVFRTTAPKERTDEERQLRKSIEDSAHALKGYVTQKGWSSVKEGGQWVVKDPQGQAVVDGKLTELQAVHTAALQALHDYKSTAAERQAAEPTGSEAGPSRAPRPARGGAIVAPRQTRNASRAGAR